MVFRADPRLLQGGTGLDLHVPFDAIIVAVIAVITEAEGTFFQGERIAGLIVGPAVSTVAQIADGLTGGIACIDIGDITVFLCQCSGAGGVGRGALGKGGQRHCGQCHAQRQNHTDEPFLHKILSFSSALQAGRFCCTQCTTFCPLWTVLDMNRPANALKRPGAPYAPAKNRKPPGLRLPDGFLLYRNYGNGILNRALLCTCSIPRTAAKVEQFCVNGP